MKKLPRSTVPLLLSLALLYTSACGTAYEPPAQEDEKELSSNNPVAADGTLEAVTWNLEWYGHNSRGPDDEVLQTKNVLRVADSLKADLYAFQEIYSQEALHKISDNMTGYNGFVGEHISWKQKTAFVYNTNTIDSLSSGPITNVREEYQEDWDYYWASGRLPLYFKFSYTFEDTAQKFYAIVIHGKANTGNNSEKEEAYQRRKKAAEGLYYYLQDQKPNANIILLGDYNDDVDVSIYDNSSESPYQLFVSNSEFFNVTTRTLTENGKSSTVSYNNMVDHITISDELYSLYIDESETVFQFDSEFIPNYGTTTSDHYPVWTRFEITK